jgi:hypothetical protein
MPSLQFLRTLIVHQENHVLLFSTCLESNASSPVMVMNAGALQSEEVLAAYDAVAVLTANNKARLW